MRGNVGLKVRVPTELERFAREEVGAGRFASVDEVMVAGLQLLRAMATPATDADVERLRAKLALGAAQADRGELVTFDDVRQRIDAVRATRARAAR